MPFFPLQPFDARLLLHTNLYVAFGQRRRVRRIHLQLYGAGQYPFFWLDDLNFGAGFGDRGTLIQEQLDDRVKPANINLPNDHENRTGCTFVSGLSVTNTEHSVWQAPLALALGMTPGGGGRGRFIVEQGAAGQVWLGHRGGLSGGGEGVVAIKKFHNLLPQLKVILERNRQHVDLIPGLGLDFGQVFAYDFVPDHLVRPAPQQPEPVFPIGALESKDFFQTLASYVHQCYVLRRLRQEGIV